MIFIDDSPLSADIRRINSGQTRDDVFHFYSAIIHTPNHDMKVMLVVNIEFDNNYATNVGEYIFIDTLVPMGDFIKFIHPYRNNLEITLTKTMGGKDVSKRFKFVILNADENISSSRYQTTSHEDLNKQELMGMSGQCIDRYLEVMRSIDASGIYRNANVETVIKAVFTSALKNVYVTGDSIKQVFDIAKPDNTRIYDHITVNPGTKIVDLPYYLQDTDYGVYNASLGMYVTQRGGDSVTSIFPLYNPVNNREMVPVLTVYAVPSLQYEFSEKTFLIESDDIYIMSSDNKKHIDYGDDAFINEGVGFKSRKANRVMNNPVMSERGGGYNLADDVNVSMRLKERSDNIMYHQHSQISDNLYKERSKFNASAGSFLQVRWNASNTSYLHPGMRVKYVYIRDKNIVVLNGVLHGHYSLYNGEARKTNTWLNIFLEKDTAYAD